jgi:hypothetical protein
MGTVIDLKQRAALVAAPKLRAEPKGYLLVPARALDLVAKIEASLDAFVAGKAEHMIDYNALYGLLAVVEMSVRYQ